MQCLRAIAIATDSQWTDVADGVLTIDSAIQIDRRSGLTVLSDAPTKTANQRRVSLDPSTLSVVARERAEVESFGPWMFTIGETPPNPDRIGYWWRLAREKDGLDARWSDVDIRFSSLFATLPIQVDIVVCQRRHGVTEFDARNLCLRSIVERLQLDRVPHLTIESREDDRDHLRTIGRTVFELPRWCSNIVPATMTRCCGLPTE